MKKTSTLKKRNSDETYHIHQALNCNPKIKYILQNVINVGKNALAVLKLSFVIGLIISEQKTSSQRIFKTKRFPRTLLLRWAQWYSRLDN